MRDQVLVLEPILIESGLTVEEVLVWARYDLLFHYVEEDGRLSLRLGTGLLRIMSEAQVR